jgi:hypothetical protein
MLDLVVTEQKGLETTAIGNQIPNLLKVLDVVSPQIQKFKVDVLVQYDLFGISSRAQPHRHQMQLLKILHLIHHLHDVINLGTLQ